VWGAGSGSRSGEPGPGRGGAAGVVRDGLGGALGGERLLHALGHGRRAGGEEGVARPGVVAHLRQGQAKVVLRLLVVGREVDGRLELLDGQRQPALLEVDQPQVDPQRGLDRVLPDQQLVHGACALERPQLEAGQAQQALGLLVLGLQDDGGFQLDARLGQLARGQEVAAVLEPEGEVVAAAWAVDGVGALRRGGHGSQRLGVAGVGAGAAGAAGAPDAAARAAWAWALYCLYNLSTLLT
jgi:hypothetical protein